MIDAAWIMFVVAVILTAGYFVLTRRRFDFLTIAYVGAIFYFSPLFFGWVLQSDPSLSETIQPTVYLIATIYVIALAGAGILSSKPERVAPASAGSARPLSRWYLILALAGLAGSIISTRGAIVNIDKLVVLSHVGYSYVLFEVAASLACISAVVERRRWELAGGIFLLFIDLLIGFRVFVTLVALSVALVLLMREGPLYLYKKAPTYGFAAVILLVAMMSANAIRPTVYDQFAKIVPAGGADKIQRSETDKNSQTRSATGQAPVAIPTKAPMPPLTISNWKAIASKLVIQSGEPFVVEATLVAIVQTGLSCSPSNIFKSVFLLVPPGMARFAPANPFPPTFYDEYQPILYPNIDYGTGGNIWAEMLCRFGYVGMAIFGVLLILVLIGLNRLLLKSSPTLVSPIAIGGIIVAFYINRNDLHFTLQMLKWIALIFFAAYLLSLTADKVKRTLAR
ncbi:MAG TPA: hypothetical protein VN838_18860 [Bradyrhizobium sp.]|nr:hypothetical protein [Bradyrhizobium sp.]